MSEFGLPIASGVGHSTEASTTSASLAGESELSDLLLSAGGSGYSGGGESKRRSRNLNEKKRRDLFNSLVNELAILIGSRNRRSDKAKILKDTLQFLKLHADETSFSTGDLDETVKPAFLTNSELLGLYLQSHSGFLIQFSVDTGSIRSVSEEISACLGHEPQGLIGESFYSLVHPSERDQVATWCLKRSQSPDQSQVVIRCALERAPDPAAAGESVGQLQRRAEYCAVELIGFLRCQPATGPAIGAVVRRYAGNCQPPAELSLPLGPSFQARLSLAWRFTEVDPRCSLLIGQRASALIGRSGFDLCHPADLETVAAFLERLRTDGLAVCHACRHVLPSGDWLWLSISAHANYAQWSGRPESYTCVYSSADHRGVAPASSAVAASAGAVASETASSSSAVPTDSAADGASSVWEDDDDNNSGELADAAAANAAAAAAAAAHVGLPAAESLNPQQAELYAQLCARYSQLSAAVRRNQEELEDVSRKLAMLSAAATSAPPAATSSTLAAASGENSEQLSLLPV